MAQLGNFGRSLIFQVSDESAFTFNNFKRDVSGRWQNHELLQRKAASEFLGPGLQTISLDIVLSVSLGIKPRAMLEEIEKLIENGTIETFVINGKRIGTYKWKILSSSESWNRIYSGGELGSASITLNLEEYEGDGIVQPY